MAHRVCIIGGGVAGLTAAYELSRTAELRAAYDIEIVELTHRLGGRLASAHHEAAWGRNEEHGLHVWFGFYDNTLRLAEQVWADAPIPADCPWRSVYDGLRPITHSDHAVPLEGSWAVRRVTWSERGVLPETPSVQALALILRGLAGLIVNAPLNVASLGAGVGWEPGASPLRRTLRRLEARLAPILASLADSPLPVTASGRREIGRVVCASLRRLHPLWLGALRRLTPDGQLQEGVHVADLALAALRGLCDPSHGILEDGDLDRVSAWELSAWLRHHGASAEAVSHSQWLEALYDIPFAFRDGDRSKRVMEASTALRYSLRMAFGYREAVAYLLEAGAGETLVAPLVALLRERGVQFRMFHRLCDLRIDEHGQRLTGIELVRAARCRGDSYDPLRERRGFLALRDGPDFDQLVDGDALRRRGVRFDSRFGDRGETDRVSLRLGRDFDDVILALPLGSVKEDGDGHSPVAAWLAHHPPARACLSRLHLVPTVAAQVWLDDPPDELGLVDRAVVTWAPPYSVICDMSPVIAHESWREPAPRSCAYLCGAWPLTAHRAPSADTGALARDHDEALGALQAQLADHGATLLGSATLHRPPGVDDPWAAQLVRANVEPWDLADLPLPGANEVRLEATDTGLRNLALAGTWVRTLVNTTSVEAAVASGIAAARAVGAEVQPILAESLLRAPPEQMVLPTLKEVDDVVQRRDVAASLGTGPAAQRRAG